MEETKNNTSQTKSIVALILVIVALVIGVKVIFGMIEAVMPKYWAAQVWDDMQTESGGTALYDLRMIQPEEFDDKDIQKWLEVSQEAIGHNTAGITRDGDVFWLYRQDSDEYVLYLPDQDRVLENADLSATEEVDEDGETTLVLRARTPEDGEEVVPEEQLFSIKTESEAWRGLRVKVILDGRERYVNQLTSRNGQCYSTEEWYIGRF